MKVPERKQLDLPKGVKLPKPETYRQVRSVKAAARMQTKVAGRLSDHVTDTFGLSDGNVGLRAPRAAAVLEHLSDPLRAVEQVWRVLKPGGVFFSYAPFYHPYHASPHDYFRFTEEGYRHLLRAFSLNKVLQERVKDANNTYNASQNIKADRQIAFGSDEYFALAKDPEARQFLQSGANVIFKYE